MVSGDGRPNSRSVSGLRAGSGSWKRALPRRRIPCFSRLESLGRRPGPRGSGRAPLGACLLGRPLSLGRGSWGSRSPPSCATPAGRAAPPLALTRTPLSGGRCLLPAASWPPSATPGAGRGPLSSPARPPLASDEGGGLRLRVRVSRS